MKLMVEQIAGIVHDLKPHFSLQEIGAAVSELVKEKYIEVLRPTIAR